MCSECFDTAIWASSASVGQLPSRRCAGALASVLATLHAASVAAYATGMAVPMLGATLAVGVGLDAGRPLFARNAGLVRRAAGLVVLLAGLGQLARSMEVMPGV